MLRRLLENFLHKKYWTKSVIYEVIKKNIIYAYNLHKLKLIKYAVFEKNNTEVFLFAQFLRCVPNFAAIGPFGAEIWRGASEAPPPPPSILMERNRPVQLGLMPIPFYGSRIINRRDEMGY